jgi:hypothetical protein
MSVLSRYILLSTIQKYRMLHKNTYNAWGHNVSGNSKTYLGLHVEGSIFLFYSGQIWSFSTDLHQSPQY